MAVGSKLKGGTGYFIILDQVRRVVGRSCGPGGQQFLYGVEQYLCGGGQQGLCSGYVLILLESLGSQTVRGGESILAASLTPRFLQLRPCPLVT